MSEKKGKTPYELRFDTLSMAKDMLDRQYDIAVDAAHMHMDKYAEAAANPKEFFEKYTPKMYKPEEIIKTASELYKFVSEKK
ncbi:MAG: hypothetical protein QGH83_13245 [Candidatus Pacebacteria bacterium]|jgi:hypothetical protein|nr:hypothetical protein [Candidatus Paceibacterota bacterium]